MCDTAAAMSGLLIGYARVSTDAQDVTAQRDALEALGVAAERLYVDHGLTAPTAIDRGCAKLWLPAGPGTPWS